MSCLHLQKLEYSYETNSSGVDSTEEYMAPPPTATFSSSAHSKGGMKIRDDEVIKVNVKWDNFEESFDLHNKSKYFAELSGAVDE